MSTLRITGLQIGSPRTFGRPAADDPMDREWTTGFSKEPAAGPMRVTSTGIEGDGQADIINHGGHDKAICVYPADHHAAWKDELGVEPAPGSFGENFTTLGMTETEVCIGDVFQCGDVLLQISQPRQPCWKLARRWRIKDLAARVEKTGRTGWYFRVLSAGMIKTGAVLTLTERGTSEWTIAAANEVMHHRKPDTAAALALAAVPALSTSWKESLVRRASAE